MSTARAGTSARPPRRIARLRGRAVRRRPVVPERRRALRVPRASATSAGLDGVHLQCHIGTDTVSLARLGASMTGLDFSAPPSPQARRLAAGAREPTIGRSSRPTSTTPLDALGGERFDLVYTGVGALCWLPDVRRWADVVAGMLRPGGRLFIREGHPMLWALTTRARTGCSSSSTRTSSSVEPMVWDEAGTYVETEAGVHAQPDPRVEPRPRRDRGTPCSTAGLELTALVEHDSVPWDAAAGPDGPARAVASGGFAPTGPWRLPHSYTLQAVKPRG